MKLLSFRPFRATPLLLMCLGLLCTAFEAQAQEDAEDIRIIAGVSSADQLMADLEHIVVGLAERKDSYENNIFPNLDIFLYGIDRTQPIRFDPIFSAEHGMELQLILPISDLNEFLADNLEPIGIDAKRSRSDRDLYELTGNVFEGWLRVLEDPDYVVIFPRQEAIPKGMEHPAKASAEFIEKGFLVFASASDTNVSVETRTSAFAQLKESALEKIKKRPDESKALYELRRAIANQQLVVLEQWFVEGKNLTVGASLDRDSNTVATELSFVAADGTGLKETIARVEAEPSYFAAIAATEEALLDLRLNYKYDEETAEAIRKTFELSQTVANEQIKEDEKASDAEKDARARINELINTALSETTELGAVDAVLDIIPSGDKYALVVSVRCNDQDDLLKAVQALPSGRDGWELKQDVKTIEGVSVHQLELGRKTPEALKELYGDNSGTIHIAISDKAFWLAFGEGAEAELEKRIKAVRTSGDVEPSKVISRFSAQLGPLVTSMNSLLNDDASVFGDFVNTRRQRRQRRSQESGEESATEERQVRQAASQFLSLDWVEKVEGTLDGADDSLTFLMRVTDDGEVRGEGEVHEGVLKAIGVLISNFADENLQ